MDTAKATTTEASKMLEEALLQMDGIINQSGQGAGGGRGGIVGGDQTSAASSPNPNGSCNILNERSVISNANVLSTAKTLALALQQVGLAAPTPDPVTAVIIGEWLDPHIPRPSDDERVRRVLRDKESLALQYQMVADKVCEQADRIVELEGLLAEKTQQLSAKDELLQRQLCTRSELETQKLELMSALSELKLHRAALERENMELKNFENLTISQEPLRRVAAPFGSMGNLNQATQSPKTPPSSLRHQIHPLYHSLPRSQCHKNNNRPKLPINPNHLSNNNNNNNSTITNNNSNKSCDNNRQRNVAFASNEKILIDDDCGRGGGSGQDGMYDSFMSQSNSNSTPSPTLKERSAKGFRQILGKLRRSNSGNLELPALEQAEPEFRRGDRARATAGGRIEWSTQTPQGSMNSNRNWKEWTLQDLCNWLNEIGLQCYEDECRKWLKNYPVSCFFNASPVDIEKELGLKSPLHRKKIVLAMDELCGREEDPLALKAAQLDIGWVVRWLDDIGLPQYKDNFLQCKVDGRMLHRLTMEDLAQLQVTSCLHIASLRRGIQCMREMDWNPECLIRRSTKVPKRNSSELQEEQSEEIVDTSLEYIALWTAHRVMEWLRVADLSEYAPNLRGAGVHGALMLYEPRFNAELLADLLSIPPSKTLLRRHLATHFKELLGRDVIQGKRDTEAQPNYQPLTITAKLKPPKKTQFSLKRRKSTKGLTCGGTEIEWTDYVCPMNSGCTSNEPQHHNNSNTSSSSTNSTSNSTQLQ
ncbi:liprin-beta-2 [Musca domestica]|uniref:Liprin-beta-2 n=1 Tax=Musca domestica TaxID=7370 RepID=A0A9J7CP84_MUSDO|nr:liprin-beta-2 [Musca domestica]